jgi:hypothetical protein
MEYLAMFVASFFLEVAASLYTIYLTRGSVKATLFMSGLYTYLSYTIWRLVIFDERLIPAAVAGVVAGTAAALFVSKRKVR